MAVILEQVPNWLRDRGNWREVPRNILALRANPVLSRHCALSRLRVFSLLRDGRWWGRC